MVTLSLLKYLENNGFGQIDVDLFWGKMGLGETGVYISDTGASQDRTSRQSTSYVLYCRGTSDVEGFERLQKIVDFLNQSYDICVLPPVPPITNYSYKNVLITRLSTISNVGEDINGRLIYNASGRVYYGGRKYIARTQPILAQTGYQLLTENGQMLMTEGI